MGILLKSRRLKINGLVHSFYTWGAPSKPALFLFHGWMDTGASFAFIAEHLQKHFYCIAPDLRGFGGSEHTRNPLGYFFYEYAADAHAIIDAWSRAAAAPQPVRIVGHSMGGNILSLYAGTFPERVSHFVNIEGFGARSFSASAGPGRMREWILASAHRFKPYPSLDAVAERLVAANPRLPFERARFLARYVTKRDAHGYRFSADPRHKWPHPYLYRLETVTPFWEAITAKCLLVSAAKTEIAAWMQPGRDMNEEIAERLAHYPPHAKHVVMPDCGHMIHHERPKELAGLMLDFLTDG